MSCEEKNEKKVESYGITCMLTPNADYKKENPANTKPEEIKKTLRTLSCSEYGRMLDLGLGRGVNATDDSPWFEKSTFQVREVTPHNIVGTDEGGILKSYEKEIWSIEEVQSQLTAKVPVNETVSIGIDAELSRGYSSSRRAIGHSLVTRTISFKPEFELRQKVICSCKNKDQKGADSPASIMNEALLPTFEERLVQWILNKDIPDKITVPNTTGVHPLDSLIAGPGLLGDTSLRERCLAFIKNFGVTHFVSGIKLGAAKYRVLSEEDYLHKVKAKSQLEILSLANVSTVTKAIFSRGTNQSLTTEIGRFKTSDDNKTTVEMGSVDEAVVGVELQSIASLIKHKDLKEELVEAIKDYIKNQNRSKGM